MFLPILDIASESCPRGQRCERTTALSFLQKTISSSGRGAPGGSPPRSPRSRTGSAHSPRGGSRTWSVLRDLRGTRNAVTIWKLAPPIHASTRPSDTASTDCSPWDGKQVGPDPIFVTSYMCVKVQQKPCLFFSFGNKNGRRVIHRGFLASPYLTVTSHSLCVCLGAASLDPLPSSPSLMLLPGSLNGLSLCLCSSSFLIHAPLQPRGLSNDKSLTVAHLLKIHCQPVPSDLDMYSIL